jgi:protein-disulfide isomerase
LHRTGSTSPVQLVLTAVMAGAAVAVAAALWRQPVVPPPPPIDTEFSTQSDWRVVAAAGQRMGRTDAPVTIVVLSDYQCPACEVFAAAVDSVRMRHPSDVAVVFRHFPLDRPHPFANAAALASECAADQGRFSEMHAALFAKRREIGVTSWREFASRAGVSDLQQFDVCVRDSIPVARVRRDRALAAAIAARGTPTVLVNDVRFSGNIPVSKLDSVVRAVRGRIAR